MYFGLTTADIVNSFSQTLESDFGVGVVSGGTIIANEMAFQYEKLMTVLSTEVLQMFDRVNNEIAMVDISGGFNPTLWADPASLRGYIVYKGYSPCPNQTLESFDMCWQSVSNEVLLSPATIVSSGSNHYHLIDAMDTKTYNLVLYYNVDATQLVIPSLKSLLRDMVAYNLGSRLFPVGTETWSIVKYYGEECDKWLKYYEDGGVPAEFKKMRQLNKKSGISSLRLARS